MIDVDGGGSIDHEVVKSITHRTQYARNSQCAKQSPTKGTPLKTEKNTLVLSGAENSFV